MGTSSFSKCVSQCHESLAGKESLLCCPTAVCRRASLLHKKTYFHSGSWTIQTFDISI